jgi:hypothetical protein
MNRALNAIHYHGIHTESLGHYLTGLGLLSGASRQWPTVRGCWRVGHFVLLGESLSDEQVRKYLLTSWQPTTYRRSWAAEQKKGTKARSSVNVWRVRNESALTDARILDAHIVGVGRNQFNPVLGTGGNIGKRDLAKMYNDANNLWRNAKESDRADWLEATLMGEVDVAFPDLKSAGTWFIFANKTFNSGQSWYREGRLSPWSVLLAMEGALLLAGGAGNVVQFAVGGRVYPPMSRWVKLTERFRGRVLRHRACQLTGNPRARYGDLPEPQRDELALLSGKDGRGTPLEGHPHA